MTPEPQPEQHTEQIDPIIERFDELSWLTWAELATRSEIEEHERLTTELSKRLAGPSLTVIEQEIRRVVEDWEQGSPYRLYDVDRGDLVDRLRDAFVELHEGRME